jgi:hypothetical protein
MSNRPSQRPQLYKQQQQTALCFPCSARAKAAVAAGMIKPQDAGVNFMVTWGPVVTASGQSIVVPLCSDCIPMVDFVNPNALDTRTKLSDHAMKAGHNG